MCGILGCFNDKNAAAFIRHGLLMQKNRRRDAVGYSDGQRIFTAKNPKGLRVQKCKNCIGHSLHSIVAKVPQPLKEKGLLIANCEIYNWEILNAELELNAKNDSHILLHMLDKGHKKKDILQTLHKLDGVYAFCYWNKDEVILARDLLGEKPIHYYKKNKAFAFASERKVLVSYGLDEQHIKELNPRHILYYSIKTGTLTSVKRPFFSIKSILTQDKQVIIQTLEKKIMDAIQKRIPQKKFGVLFSGGVDSTLVAYILKKLGKEVICYTAALDEPNTKEAEDLTVAQTAAKELGLKLRVIKVSLKDVEKSLPKVIPLIESSNVVKVGVALPFYYCCQAAKKDGIKVLFSGLGSDEIFAGYQRHEDSHDVNNECVSGLLKMYERDLYRDDVITMDSAIELRLPYLDIDLVEYALQIPQKYKISGTEKKIILRETAQKIGLADAYAWRPKKAAQYGSKFDKAIDRLSTQKKFTLKSQYLNTFYPPQNERVAILFSSGKDSMFAMHAMLRQGYSISCLITLNSKNPDSYMFHTPTVELAKLQAKALNLPLIMQTTKGEKELELKDLKTAINKARKRFNIDGIVTGALYSVYQRDRVEIIAEELGIKVFSPLWHIDQEKEFRSIIDTGYKIIFTRVAAQGLDASWLGRIMTNADIDNLVGLHHKYKINIAGEGGEFESLVLDGPEFKKKLVIDDSQTLDEGSSYRLIVKKASLKNKSASF